MKRIKRAAITGSLLLATLAIFASAKAEEATCAPTGSDADIIAACTSVIDVNGQDERKLASAHAFRAGAFSRQRKFDAAITDYDAALRLQPHSAPIHLLRGLTFAEMSKHDDAVKDFTKSITIFPKSHTAHFRRGLSNAKLGNYQQAVIDYSTAIELDPDDSRPYAKRGVVQFTRGKRDLAISDFSKAIERDPNDVESLNNRCFVRAVANVELDKALEDCETAMKLKPQSGIHDSRGFVHLRLGKFREAIADFDAAVASNPRAADALFKRGVAKLRLGDATGGNDDLVAAKALNSQIAKEMASFGVQP